MSISKYEYVLANYLVSGLPQGLVRRDVQETKRQTALLPGQGQYLSQGQVVQWGKVNSLPGTVSSCLSHMPLANLSQFDSQGHKKGQTLGHVINLNCSPAPE